MDQMLDLRQSSSCVSNYINAFEELIQCCELGSSYPWLWSDLKLDVTFSSRLTVEEAYHKAFEVENLISLFLCGAPGSRLDLPSKLPLRYHNFRPVLLILPSLTRPCLLVLLEHEVIRPCNVLVVGEEVIMLPNVLIAPSP